jgi:hypothetical protein
LSLHKNLPESDVNVMLVINFFQALLYPQNGQNCYFPPFYKGFKKSGGICSDNAAEFQRSNMVVQHNRQVTCIQRKKDFTSVTFAAV